MSNFYCPRIKNGIAFTPNRDYDVCGVRDLTTSSKLGIQATSYDDFMNSDYKLDLLNHNNSDTWPRGCEGCKWFEDIGLISSRQSEITLEQNQGDQPLVHLNSGNICDSDCIMCGPRWSTTIANRLKKHPDPNQEYFKLGDDKGELPFNKKSLANISTAIQQAKRIKVVGGEPFLDKKLWKFLDEVARKDLTLYIITNGNTYPNYNQQNILNKFGKIEVSFSVDGTGLLYEWIRQNLNYKTLIKNYLKMRTLSNFSVNVLCVAQAHNILDLINLRKAFQTNISFSPLVHPSLLAMQNAPRWAIDKAKEDNEGDDQIQKILKLAEGHSNLQELIKHTKYLNGHRTLHFDVNTWGVQ